LVCYFHLLTLSLPGCIKNDLQFLSNIFNQPNQVSA
jgi:hypothetical protein